MSRLKLGDLSPESKAARAPLPPDELVGALQDRVHRDPGHGRAAKTVRHRKAWSMLAEAEREEKNAAARANMDDAANLKRDGERVAVFTLNDAKEENHDHSEE